MVKRAEHIGEAVLEVAETEQTSVEPTAFSQFVEHQKKAVTEIGKALSSLLPEGLREHGDAALKEIVEGYRSLFNATLDEVIKTAEKAKLEKE
jgi:hypothetical protein